MCYDGAAEKGDGLMSEWHRQIQMMIEEIDRSIRRQDDEALALKALAEKMGYSEYHLSRKFSEIAGISFREYLRGRRLAFALKQVRDTKDGLLEIALEFGFSSHEAFTRAFRENFGMTPSEYRLHPVPVVLRTVIRPLDCYLLGMGGTAVQGNTGEVKTYFVTIPAHKFLHIRNDESIGYWDFWQKQSLIEGQDCETICGLLDSIQGKLDDRGGSEANSGSGQVMAFLNTPEGRICSWGIPLAECYGVRLPLDYTGEVPPQMRLMEVPEGEYIVFEHGPFDYETENSTVEARIEAAMKAFDYEASGYMLDLTPGRIFYFHHDCERFWKYIRPVRKI